MMLRNWGWFRLWQKVKPLLSVSRQEDKVNALKEKAQIAVDAVRGEKQLRKELQSQKESLAKEKKALKEQLESTKGNVSHFLEEQAKTNAQRKELEDQLMDANKILEAEIDSKQSMLKTKTKVEQQVVIFKREVDELEQILLKAEQEKAHKDHQIRNLNDEIAHQDETINKVNRDKKMLQEGSQKGSDEVHGIADKATHLNKVKEKLERTLFELEDAVDRERNLRMEIEKSKRKFEGDVKLTQETVGDLEKAQKEVENNVYRKEKELSTLGTKLEEAQISISKVTKETKEMSVKIEDLEEELEHERQARAKSEKDKGKVAKEMDDLIDRLDEAGGATMAQGELYKKREAELAKLRRDLEECAIQQDAALASLRKKHNDGLAEMAQQLDHLSKQKNRIEKEKDTLKREGDDAKAAMDGLSQEKASVEKITKQLQNQMNDLGVRFDEANRSLHDYDALKKKLAVENFDLLHQLSEVDHQNGLLHKIKLNLTNQLEETKKLAEDEGRERGTILGKFRNLEHDLDNLRAQRDEENEHKVDLQRVLVKSNAEALMYRTKYESEGIARSEELEASRLKLAARLEDSEQTIEQLHLKVTMLEKNRDKLGLNHEAKFVELERAQAANAAAEKKQKSFEKIIFEWRVKVDDLALELDTNQKECRNYSTELFRIKNMYDENMEQLEGVRKDNKNLTDEIKDLIDQIGEGGRNMHEVAKNTKHLEIEREELQSALEEAEAALEQEENKVLRGQLELSQVRQEIDRRIQEKEEEFEETRKTHARAVENLQMTYEAEAKGKYEAIRMKKKLESDINELEIGINHASKANQDLQKSIKKSQGELFTMQQRKEEEHHMASEYREQYAISERRANALHGELEESRTLLEQSDRGRRQAEAELAEAHDQINDLSNIDGSLLIAKRKLESEMQTLHTDLDDVLKEAKNSQDKAKKAMVDAARLADELRSEQEHSQSMERTKKGLELNVKDLQKRLEEVETNALKTGKMAVGKLESKVRDMEGQLDDEARRHSDSQKALRTAERRIKELSFQSMDDQKNHERMQETVDKLQQKIKTYKRQIEEAEEIAAMNLAKFRRAQQDMDALELQ